LSERDLVEVVEVVGTLEPSEAPTRARVPPVAVYLARIRAASRRVVEGRLRACARIVGDRSGDVLAFPWEGLEVEHVAALTNAVRERFAPSTGRAILVALRGVLRACWQAGAYGWEGYERRVDAFARIEGVRLARGRALAPREVSAMHCQASPRDRALLALLFGAGLRRSEAAGLTWDRFDGEALRVLGKGDRERVVPLQGWAVLALRAIRPTNPAPASRILRSVRGESLTDEGVRFALAQLARRAGVLAIMCHDGRRTFISELLDVTDLATAADLAGHASADQTRSYDRRGARAGRDAVARLRSMVEPD